MSSFYRKNCEHGNFWPPKTYPKSSQNSVVTERPCPNENVLMPYSKPRTTHFDAGPNTRFQTTNPNKTFKRPTQRSDRTKRFQNANARTKSPNKTDTTARTKHANKPLPKHQRPNKTHEQNKRKTHRTKHPNKTCKHEVGEITFEQKV